MYKYIFPLFISSLLAACGDQTEVQTQPEAASEIAASQEMHAQHQVETVVYAAENGEHYKIETSDNFKTATLIGPKGEQFSLKEVVSASGMQLDGENGVSIHIKNNEGMLEIEKDKVINLKEVAEGRDHKAEHKIETVVYATENGDHYKLESSDNFKTATLVNPEGDKFNLKEAVSASGMKLDGANGISIHVEKDEGMLELGKDQTINLKEVK